MTEFTRRSARVLLLDASDRLLLVQSGDAWLVPGGGVEEGEGLAEAAARDLREETGSPSHPPTCTRSRIRPAAPTLGGPAGCSAMTSSFTASPVTRWTPLGHQWPGSRVAQRVQLQSQQGQFRRPSLFKPPSAAGVTRRGGQN
jgi:8-oxo-dGTP pyrophosphatase MutT (NUDIX family)